MTRRRGARASSPERRELLRRRGPVGRVSLQDRHDVVVPRDDPCVQVRIPQHGSLVAQAAVQRIRIRGDRRIEQLVEAEPARRRRTRGVAVIAAAVVLDDRAGPASSVVDELVADDARDAGRGRVVEDRQQVDLDVELGPRAGRRAARPSTSDRPTRRSRRRCAHASSSSSSSRIVDDRRSRSRSRAPPRRLAHRRVRRRRQRVAVDLAVRGHRQRRPSSTNAAGIIERGSRLARCSRSSARSADDRVVATTSRRRAGDRPARSRRATTTQWSTAGWRHQRRRDLVELDPVPADLHLVVEPAEEVDVAVRR